MGGTGLEPVTPSLSSQPGRFSAIATCCETALHSQSWCRLAATRCRRFPKLLDPWSGCAGVLVRGGAVFPAEPGPNCSLSAGRRRRHRRETAKRLTATTSRATPPAPPLSLPRESGSENRVPRRKRRPAFRAEQGCRLGRRDTPRRYQTQESDQNPGVAVFRTARRPGGMRTLGAGRHGERERGNGER